MNLLFLTLIDIEDIEESGIYQDLMRCFSEKNHNVFIVSPNEKRNKKQTRLIENDNCKILKVSIGNITKTNVIEKGISTLTIENKFKKGINKYFKDVKFDLILYSTPPITFANIIKAVKKRDNAISYLLLKDIFPQNAVDLGMFSNKGLIYRYFRNKEKKLYLISDYIGCMSQANVDFILKYNPYLDEKIVHVNPNSIKIRDDFKKNDKNVNRLKFGLPLNTNIFIYGGNLGKPQGIDFVIECLKDNMNKMDRYFVICGTGTEYYKLKNFIDLNNPNNIKLINGLQKEEYNELLQCCDIGLLFLDHRFTIPNFPSRILSYMENSMPVIACTDKNTDIGKIIVNNEFGYWIHSDDIKLFGDKIYKLINRNDINDDMGNRGYDFLLNKYSVEKSYKAIMNHINKGR